MLKKKMYNLGVLPKTVTECVCVCVCVCVYTCVSVCVWVCACSLVLSAL